LLSASRILAAEGRRATDRYRSQLAQRLACSGCFAVEALPPIDEST